MVTQHSQFVQSPFCHLSAYVYNPYLYDSYVRSKTDLKIIWSRIYLYIFHVTLIRQVCVSEQECNKDLTPRICSLVCTVTDLYCYLYIYYRHIKYKHDFVAKNKLRYKSPSRKVMWFHNNVDTCTHANDLYKLTHTHIVF